MSAKYQRLTDFLLELDALKTINRRSYINTGERLENSAEHSWHLAMACWTFSEYLQEEFDVEKLLKLALVHDLGEIDAGDTFLYSADRSEAPDKEREGVARLASHNGNSITNLLNLWDEQEYGNSKEAKLLKVLDRLLPLLLNLASEGKTWRENGITKQQVLKAHQFIANEDNELHAWITKQLDVAVSKGWLSE